MRILEFGKFYAPYRGGMETLLQSYCEDLARRGAEVCCVVANDRPRSVRENLNGVQVYRGASFGSLWSTSLSPACVLKSLQTPADLWHVHFPNPLADLACLLKRRDGTPLVISYHSDIIRQTGLLALYGHFLRRVFERATVITVATPNHLKYSRWLGPYSDKVQCIPFGIRVDGLRLDPSMTKEVNALRRRHRDKVIVLNIGRLVDYKGQEYLIRAARHCPGVVVWIVGTGPLESKLKNLSAEMGLGERVQFMGDAPPAQLAAYLNACDVFALPSVTPNEAFGLAQVEAMACGKPVICCNLRSGVPFVNQHGNTGLVVEPRDADALGQAIRRLSENPDLRHQYGKAGRLRARHEFSETVMLDRYWKLFQDLTAGKESS